MYERREKKIIVGISKRACARVWETWRTTERGKNEQTRRRGFGKQQVALETNLDGVLLLGLCEKWIATVPVRCGLIESPG